MNLDILKNKRDIQFYKQYGVKPRLLLSDCSFDNLVRTGFEVGSDYCLHVDEENFNCETCELHEQKHEYYPPITDALLLQMILVCGTKDLNCPIQYGDEMKEAILKHVETLCDKLEVKNIITKLLKAHVEEWSRM